ncbi:hypothetical protein MKX01_035921, partial [Papaver californicum]
HNSDGDENFDVIIALAELAKKGDAEHPELQCTINQEVQKKNPHRHEDLAEVAEKKNEKNLVLEQTNEPGNAE